MDNRKKLPFDVIMAIVMMSIVTAIAIDGFFIQKLPMEALKYPCFCFVIFYGACIVEIINAFCKNEKNNGEKTRIHTNFKNFYITFGLLVAYVLLMYLFGFILSSIAMTVAFTLIFKVRKPVLINAGAAVVIVAIYFIFSRVLFIFLPKGLLAALVF